MVGILGLAAREMEREPKNERGRGGGKGSLSLPFFPTPSRSFTRAIFRAVFHPRSWFFALKLQGNTGGGGALETLG